MPEVIKLFSLAAFIPHGHCYLWQPQLIWLHLLSDSITALAYYSIPITLIYLVRKRQDLPFDWVFLLFSAFIISCGTTHVMEVWTLWHPTYWLAGALKAITAILSLFTAAVLIRLMPQALTLPSPAQLSILNAKLMDQVQERQQAEIQIHQLNQDLEAKVEQRTAELEDLMSQVQDSVERITLAMDAAKMGFFDWDLTTQKMTWSHYHEILWSYRPSSAAHRYEDWKQRIHPDDLAKAEAAIRAAMKTAAPYASEYRVVWEDGSIHWVAGFGRFYFSPQGEPFRMMGMVQDITERKQVEERLAISEERLRLATEAADIGMWFWDLKEDQLVWTDCCRRLFGLTPDTAISYDRFLKALYPEDRERTDATVREAVLQKQDYNIEYRTVWGDGSVHWILAKGRAAYSEQDEPIRMMGTAQEITDRKLAEVSLREQALELAQINDQLTQTTALVNQRNQELDQFSHIVSHDLKAPLRGISSLSEWIEEDLGDLLPPDVQKNFELLRSRVTRMNDLINGLLAYARIGYQEALSETFELNELLQEVIDSLEVPPEFTVQLPTQSIRVTANRLLMNQVFSNFISNAVKYHGRPDGTIKITALSQDQSYKFSIADDGIGIASKDHDQIFEIFKTLQSQSDEKGTGVGLAIVKKIMDRVGGQIDVESELGKGTAFHISWPFS